jgi:hypothetical protein
MRYMRKEYITVSAWISQRRGRSGGVTQTQRRSGDEGVGLAGPIAAPGYGGALRPVQGEQEVVRWAGDSARRCSETEDRRWQPYHFEKKAATWWTSCTSET